MICEREETERSPCHETYLENGGKHYEYGAVDDLVSSMKKCDQYHQYLSAIATFSGSRRCNQKESH